MGLVEYPESEGSDVEEKQEAKIQKPALKTGKPAFQKVVDRSNPHKIRVSLPELEKDSTEDKHGEDGPPAKKVRTGGGAFSGFNSFLPAPKHPAAGHGAPNGAGAKKGGLGSGVNLRTGPTPGFSREPVIESGLDAEEASQTVDGEGSMQENVNSLARISTENSGSLDLPKPQSTAKAPNEPRKQGNPMMFKPLSVTRKPQKKRALAMNGEAAPEPKDNSISTQSKAPPKVSLFSAETSQNDDKNGNTSNNSYQPMVYRAHNPEIPSTEPLQSEHSYIEESEPNIKNIPQINDAQGPQSLDTIALDLNLSASAKRQLFGRQKANASAINIVNFNTDQEYAANELLRQAGEQVQHSPVRAIAPGKHSLKQLVNAASNQKDALEEQFASGRRNKKEAGSKYGW